MHPLLARQLRRHGASAVAPPADWAGFLAAIDDAYRTSENDRALWEHSMELASAELIERHQRLRAEMDRRESVEAKLQVKQRMESVGQLAAGIAHEINTPIQYIGDTASFLNTACEDLRTYLDAARRMARIPAESPDAGASHTSLLALEEELDLDFVWDRIPGAFARLFDGVQRVSVIVRAMKEFAHPDRPDMASADINRAIETTVLVSQAEYKRIARLQLSLELHTPAHCHIGQINQVVLNLVVNAAHAITDAGRTPEEGLIQIRTREEGDHALIEVEDNGCGIPDDVRQRMYDPFFTTKEVGRGSGQGLALARAIIVENHGGQIDVRTELGKGTCFSLRLPFRGADEQRRAG